VIPCSGEKLLSVDEVSSTLAAMVRENLQRALSRRFNQAGCCADSPADCWRFF
tara:strand:+ start:26 stop:184 length:159 start_codon:yes stop_codon:yes gene_type:complete